MRQRCLGSLAFELRFCGSCAAMAAAADDEVMGFPAEEYKRLRTLFISWDTSGEGSLDADELRAGLEGKGAAISAKEADEMIRDADDDGNGRIRAAVEIARIHGSTAPRIRGPSIARGRGVAAAHPRCNSEPRREVGTVVHAGTVEWDEFLGMLARARDAGVPWLQSWLPRLAKMRLDAKADVEGRSDAGAGASSAAYSATTGPRTLRAPRELTAAERAELRAAFDLIDDDNSGRLDAGEILDALSDEGIAVDEEAVTRMCVEAGEADGEVTREGFETYVAARAPPPTKRHVAISRDWWWRWLFPSPEDVGVMTGERRLGDDDDAVLARRRAGLADAERPPHRLDAAALRKSWSTAQRRKLDVLFEACALVFGQGGSDEGSRLSADALSASLVALGAGAAAADDAAAAVAAGGRPERTSRVAAARDLERRRTRVASTPRPRRGSLTGSQATGAAAARSAYLDQIGTSASRRGTTRT